MTNTWITTVPVKGDDEILLDGLAFPVPAGGLPGGIKNVSWHGTFGTNGTPGVSIQWQWERPSTPASQLTAMPLALRRGTKPHADRTMATMPELRKASTTAINHGSSL
jgi:hypothetical protein